MTILFFVIFLKSHSIWCHKIYIHIRTYSTVLIQSTFVQISRFGIVSPTIFIFMCLIHWSTLAIRYGIKNYNIFFLFLAHQLILFHFLPFTVCTPLGFIRLFGVVGQVLVKPHLMRDVNEEYHASYLEEASVLRKIENLQYNQTISSTKLSTNNIIASNQPSKYCDINSIPKAFGSLTVSLLRHRNRKPSSNNIILNHKNQHSSAIIDSTMSPDTTDYTKNIECDELNERLRKLRTERKELDKLRSSTAIQRNLVYPLAMLMLLFLTGLTVLVVVQNTLELLIGIKALPLSTRVNLFDNSFAIFF